MTFDHESRAALRERFAGAPHLPDSVLREVIDRVPETPQFGDATVHPTTGRSRSMFSAAKLVVSGALIAAFGGLALVGVLPTEPGEDLPPAVGASASAEEGVSDPLASVWVQGDPEAMAWVSGVIEWGNCSDPIKSNVGREFQERGRRCQQRTVTSDDSRLEGTSVVVWNENAYFFAGPRMAVVSLTEDIRGDGGGWVCHSGAALYDVTTTTDTPVQGSDLHTCSGDGDNEGLTALLVFISVSGSQQDTFEGLIFPGDLPPVPVLAE